MKEFTEFIVKHLVDDPESAVIEETIVDNQSVISIKVQPSDVGKIIGKKGANISAMRILVTALAAREKKRVKLEVVDQRALKNEEN
jgi:uncharacterized protein